MVEPTVSKVVTAQEKRFRSEAITVHSSTTKTPTANNRKCLRLENTLSHFTPRTSHSCLASRDQTNCPIRSEIWRKPRLDIDICGQEGVLTSANFIFTSSPTKLCLILLSLWSWHCYLNRIGLQESWSVILEVHRTSV